MFTVYSKYRLPRLIYHLIYRWFYGQTMAVKIVANTLVNGKLPLAVGNPISIQRELLLENKMKKGYFESLTPFERNLYGGRGRGRWARGKAREWSPSKTVNRHKICLGQVWIKKQLTWVEISGLAKNLRAVRVKKFYSFLWHKILLIMSLINCI